MADEGIQMVTVDSPRIPDPAFKLKMFPHQLALAYSMHELEIIKKRHFTFDDVEYDMHTNIGFLADHLGSGKTLTVLCLIHSTLEEKNIVADVQEVQDNLGSTPEPRVYNYVQKRMPISDNYVNTTLIVMPKHLRLTVWAEEIKKTGLRCAEANAIQIYTKPMLAKLDIILCQVDALNDFISEHDYIWKRVICDELDTWESGNYVEPLTRFMWIISNTPSNLPNNKARMGLLHRVKNIPIFMMQRVMLRTENSFYKLSVQLQDLKMINVPTIGLSLIDYITGGASDAVGLAIQMGDYKHARSLLDASTFRVGKPNILDEIYTSTEKAIEKYSDPLKPGMLANAETRLHNLHRNISNMKSFICYGCDGSEKVEKVLVSPCYHTICLECVKSMPKISEQVYRCPLCAESISYEGMLLVESTGGIRIMGNILYAMLPIEMVGSNPIIKEVIDPKIKFLMGLLNKHVMKSVIVYSGKESTKTVYTALKEKGYSPRLLSPGRTACLEKLKTKDIRVICADGTTVSSGLNIPYVDIVVIYDQLSHDNFKQAIGRAQRLGRTNVLTVYILGK